MNIKQFLVCKISDRFPGELNEILWENVKNDAASQIAKMYYYKVAKNNDIFLELMRMADYDLEVTEDGETQLYQLPIDWASELPDDVYQYEYPQEWSVDIRTSEKQRIAKFVKYAKKNITYKYIQEPGAWLDAIRTIREIFFIMFTLPALPLSVKDTFCNEIIGVPMKALS